MGNAMGAANYLVVDFRVILLTHVCACLSVDSHSPDSSDSTDDRKICTGRSSV